MPQYAGPLGAFVDSHRNDIYENAADPTKRYLLVEQSRFDGTFYLTSHDSRDAAATYHDSQENPDDWPIHQLVDLKTGVVIPHVTTTTWTTTFASGDGTPEQASPEGSTR